MKQKNNAIIGIFILIILSISIIMSFIIFNSHEVAALDIIKNTNGSSEIKGAKEVNEYVPIVRVSDDEETPVKIINEDNSDSKEFNQSESEKINLELIEKPDNIEVLIEEYQDEIDSKDLDQGLALMEKIDLDYLLSFDRENLTSDQKQEIKDYLKSNLTDEEYQKVIELIGKYIGLIQ